jgi:hypothetical protein
MSDPSKCVALGGATDAPREIGVATCDGGEPPGVRGRLNNETIRLIENWIVGVVTVLSAAVILVTLLAQREGAISTKTPGQAAIDVSADAR